MTLPRLTDIEQRTVDATEGPWEADCCSAANMVYSPHDSIGVDSTKADAEFIAASRQDVPALTAAIRAVLELHAPKHAIFSWNTGRRYEDPCTTCHGKAGIHECGCWAEDDTEYVCQTCADAPWPCATQQAIAQYINLEVTNV